MTDRDWIEVCLSGGELDQASYTALEQKLAFEPDDLELRIKQLGYLVSKQLPRAREVLWLAARHPTVDLAGFTVLRADEDRALYKEIREIWKRHVEGSPDNKSYREQAARFVIQDDPRYAEQLYGEGATLDPADPKWPELLGNLLMLRRKQAPDAASAIELATKAVQAYTRAHELESWDFARHGLQIDIARAAVAANLLDAATTAAENILRDAPKFERTWIYGNAIHWAHIVRGKVARHRGDLDRASEELLLSADTPGSPQLDSFGPDIELAQWLIDDGRAGVVRDYLTRCKRFWQLHDEQLKTWIAKIESGESPRLSSE